MPVYEPANKQLQLRKHKPESQAGSLMKAIGDLLGLNDPTNIVPTPAMAGSVGKNAIPLKQNRRYIRNVVRDGMGGEDAREYTNDLSFSSKGTLDQPGNIKDYDEDSDIYRILDHLASKMFR